MPASRYGMDDLAAQFVDVLWEEGESRSLAGDFLSGLSHHLPVRGLLPRAWKLFSAWQRHEMPSRATPFTLDILLAMVGAGLRLGLGHNFVTTLLVAFHCLLRTGEAMSILGRDIRFAADRSHAWISLGFTKGGKRRGVEEYVKVYDPWTVQMLLLASEELREGDKLLQLTPLQFRKAFSDCLKLLKLDRLEFRPYSLRRGGATFLFRHWRI